MSSIADVFTRARAEDRAALIGYLPAGYPSVDGSIAALHAMADAGVDMVEVGLPYTDPLLDGPTIQAAVDAALRAGVRTKDVLAVVEAVASRGVPTVVMSYWNPIERYGPDRFARDLAAAGGLGMITPDVIPEEAGRWLDAAAGHGLDPVFLVAPSSTEARIRLTVAHCRGFVYAASTMGVTGIRSEVSSVAERLVQRVREVTDLPIAVGLGVSTADQAREVGRYADGVIVGSAFVRRLLDAADSATGASAVAALAADLREGVGRAYS